MQVTVSSRHVEVSDALRSSATEKIGRLDRFLDGMTRAEVHFEHQRNPRIAAKQVCEVTILGHGHVVRTKVAAPDGFAAVDLAVEKLEQQLHRLKSRLKGKSGSPKRRLRAVDATGAAPTAPAGAPASRDGQLTLVPADGPDDDDDEHSMADDAYVTRAGELVVKKKSFAIDPVSVDDAVLQMELVDHSFYLFTNVATGRAAVLYRRDDGTLGLIDQS